MRATDSAMLGIARAQSLFMESSSTIARGEIDEYADAFVGLSLAKHAMAANAKVVAVQRDLDRSVLDILA